MMKKTLTIAFLTALSLTSCQKSQKKENTETTKQTVEINNNEIITRKESEHKKTNKFEGVYSSGTKENGSFWTEVKIEKINSSDSCKIIVSSKKLKGSECCSFNKSGVVKNDTLFIETTDWKKPVTVFITKNKSKITFDVKEKVDGDRYVLNYYCCGGGSLIGDYETKSVK